MEIYLSYEFLNRRRNERTKESAVNASEIIRPFFPIRFMHVHENVIHNNVRDDEQKKKKKPERRRKRIVGCVSLYLLKIARDKKIHRSFYSGCRRVQTSKMVNVNAQRWFTMWISHHFCTNEMRTHFWGARRSQRNLFLVPFCRLLLEILVLGGITTTTSTHTHTHRSYAIRKLIHLLSQCAINIQVRTISQHTIAVDALFKSLCIGMMYRIYYIRVYICCG